MAAGGVDLSPVQAPAFGRAARHGGGQATTGRGAQFRFDAQGVDQRAVPHGIVSHALAQRLGPACFVLQAKMLQVLHHQDQRGGRVTLADRADHPAGAGKVRAASAEGTGYGEGEQPVAVQQVEVVVGELGAAVVALGVSCEGLRQLGERAVGRLTHEAHP
ncbi:hypothetical protein D3C75_1057560 [compost metagenome]